MSLYAKHLAWLNATEEGKKKSRREEFSPGGDSSSPFLILPEVIGAEYIIQWWHEAGTFANGGMGISPLSWLEIKAWREENELELDGYEISAIRRLSVEYVSAYHASSEKGFKAPYLASVEEIDQPAVQSKFKSILGMFKRNEEDDAKYIVEPND